jgi:hypothetical protein
MATTKINTKIIVNKPVKNKCFGYTIVLDKKEPNKLMIKAKSSDGRDRGIAGSIDKNGTFNIRQEHKLKLLPLLKPKEISVKISMILDFAFGSQRGRTCCNADKNGLIPFVR